MFMTLKDSVIRIEDISAVTRSVVPATNYTPVYYTMVVYVKGVTQPLIHTYEDEQERDATFCEVRDLLNSGSN